MYGMQSSLRVSIFIITVSNYRIGLNLRFIRASRFIDNQTFDCQSLGEDQSVSDSLRLSNKTVTS